MNFGPLLILCFSAASAFAQFITHGPVLGGMRNDGLRMFIRTNTLAPFTVEIDSDSLFGAPMAFPAAAVEGLDSSVIVEINGLNAFTKYHYRVLFNSLPDIKKGSFKTFPAPGQPAHFAFVTGSCQETANMKVYDAIPTHEPLFMVHTGDYTYPSYQLPNSYPSQWYSIPWSYRRRYEEQVMKDKVIPYFPLVYMPDDDDNYGGSRTHHVSPAYSWNGNTIVNYFNVDSIYPVERENCLRGYRLFFPGYATVDTTEGHYHRFRVGNAEFFVLDCRSMAEPTFKAYRQDTSNLWVFEPPAGHSILGTNQRNWLLNGLLNSTADWKFIVSGVPFNPKVSRIIQAGLQIQDMEFLIAGETGTGLRLSASFAGYWGGYPEDVQALTSHVKNNNIKGVLMISGDTHHNVIDDGTNSVFPELNASGLSVTTTELAYQISQYAALLGQPPVRDSLWNGGGNGLGNTNFKNAFGKVEVFGSDSVEYCVIDEDNVPISCITIYSDGTVYNPSSIYEAANPDAAEKLELLVYPSPNAGEFKVRIKSFEQYAEAELSILDNRGKTLLTRPLILNKNEGQTLSLSLGKELGAGVYYAVVRKKNVGVLGISGFQKQ